MNWYYLWLALSLFGFFDGLIGAYEMSKEKRPVLMVVTSLLSIVSLYFAIHFAVIIFK